MFFACALSLCHSPKAVGLGQYLTVVCPATTAWPSRARQPVSWHRTDATNLTTNGPYICRIHLNANEDVVHHHQQDLAV